MRRSIALCIVLSAWAGTPATAQTDVPANHWARAAVRRVTSAGALSAASGKFLGGAYLTRIDLVKALHRLAVRLKSVPWPTDAVGKASAPASGSWKRQSVTRYEAAWAIDRVVACTEATLERPLVTPKHRSGALPPAISPSSLPKAGPAATSLRYLAAHRMVWPRSPLLKPGPEPVTCEQLATALAEFVAGFMAECTDEPELLEMDRNYRSGGHGAKRVPLRQAPPIIQ